MKSMNYNGTVLQSLNIFRHLHTRTNNENTVIKQEKNVQQFLMVSIKYEQEQHGHLNIIYYRPRNKVPLILKEV